MIFKNLNLDFGELHIIMSQTTMSQPNWSLFYLNLKEGLCVIIQKKIYSLNQSCLGLWKNVSSFFVMKKPFWIHCGFCMILQRFSLWTGLVQPLSDNWYSCSLNLTCLKFCWQIRDRSKDILVAARFIFCCVKSNKFIFWCFADVGEIH